MKCVRFNYSFRINTSIMGCFGELDDFIFCILDEVFNNIEECLKSK
jgi:hypothetical protein